MGRPTGVETGWEERAEPGPVMGEGGGRGAPEDSTALWTGREARVGGACPIHVKEGSARVTPRLVSGPGV